MTLSIHAVNPDPFAGLRQFFARLERPGAGEIRQVATAVAQGHQDNFSNERSGSGDVWPELSRVTVLERVQQGYPGAHPILRRSGRLRDSLVNPAHADHYQAVNRSADGWSLEVGTNVDYALDLEVGAGRMPARPFTDLSDEAENRIATVLEFVIFQAQAATVGR